MKNSWKLVTLPQIHDARGDLTVVEGSLDIPFEIKRVYYLYNVPCQSSRGGHAHLDLEQVLFALSGSFRVNLNDGTTTESIWLSNPSVGLYLKNMVWRELDSFSQGSVLMVLASQHFDENDYIRDFYDFSHRVSSS